MAETKIYIPDAVDAQLREAAMKRFGYGRGSISKAVETAIIQWLAGEGAVKEAIEVVTDKAGKDKNVIAVLLFGSYARKDSAFEDVDVALVVKDSDKTDILAYSRAIEDMGIAHKISIDFVELNRMPIATQSDILDEALVLYVRNKDELFNYCMRIMEESDDARHVRSILAS